MTDTITTTDLREIDEAMDERDYSKNIPAGCEKCGLMNSENCNTCPELEKHGYSFETGI